MLESPNLYAWYPYTYRWWQRIWNFSKSSSFEIIQILVILPKNAISLVIFHKIASNFLSVWGKVIYIIYQTGFIMWLPDHLRKWKYRWRGRILKENCYFSLPASPPTLLMLESPNLYAWYPYTYRWWQRIWNISTSSSFEIIQILVILPKNAISLGIYHEISSKYLSIWGGGCHIHHILNVCYFSLPASSALLMLESPNLYAWYPYAYRWWQRIWNFSTSSSFEIIQILFFCDFTQKYKFSALKKVSLIS